ncbi:cuticle protein-like [Diorhabda carinulata]|uniref:cuticle protein-like n=1 Tax=Diorhabda carinulata TaxID=1163345 RepID=UPI0025A09D9E|nr:cuticle protein-like [Diorhabda carinulata]
MGQYGLDGDELEELHLCDFLIIFAVSIAVCCAVEDKKEKRGLLGLGNSYFDGHGESYGYGDYSAPILSKSIISAPLISKSYLSAPISYSAPIISKPISYAAPILTKSYAAPLISAPLLTKSVSYAAPISYPSSFAHAPISYAAPIAAPISYAAPIAHPAPISYSAPLSYGYGSSLGLGYGKYIH